jgi:hypothetical protein
MSTIRFGETFFFFLNYKDLTYFMENVGYFSTKIIIWILACGNITGVAIFNNIFWLSFA